MQRNLRLQIYKIAGMKNSQRGYMLITLMLAMALMSLALLVMLPDVGQQIKRDREDEMRHRGTAYMRAIQHFYKKFGRNPSRIEELENTNNLRFLRKRYTDPLTRDASTGKEKDFKLLHQQDISLSSGLVLPGATPGGIPGQTPGLTGPGGAAQLLQSAIATQAAGVQPTLTQNASADASDATTDNPSSSGSTSSSPSPSSSSASGFNGPTFGGGPILGVASTSKAKSIRVFNDKSHYNDWLFVYIPQADRGGLLVGPVSTNGPTGGFGGIVPPNQPGQGMTTSSSPSSSMQPGSSVQPTQNMGQIPQQ
jgi:type II secretory pathway pseudopilin PulG